MSEIPNSSEGNWRFWFACIFIIPVIDFFTLKALPYDFFQLLRIVAFGGFAYLAFTHYVDDDADETGVYVFGAFAALYNPFFRVEMTRELWTGANLISAFLVFAQAKNLIFQQKRNLNDVSDFRNQDKKEPQLQTRSEPRHNENYSEKRNLSGGDMLHTIQDFMHRIGQVDDDALVTLKIQSTSELLDLFKMSPTAESWFLELDPRHTEDLKNLQAATWLKIQVEQAAGNFSEVPSKLLMLIIITGILENSVTEIAFELWQDLTNRTSEKLADLDRDQLSVIALQESITRDQSDQNFLVSHARTWEPYALIEKYFEAMDK